MIRLEGLKKYFTITKGLMKKEVTYVKAVDDISLEIKKGEIVGLVGESGSGKTTLARVLCTSPGADSVYDSEEKPILD